MTENQLKPRFWNDFVEPLHTMEATRLIAKRPAEVLAGRGDQGETALHWAALNNLGLILDLIGLGLEVNVQDAKGRTPLDWQNSRLWHICVERETPMSEAGRLQIRHQSEALIQALWRLGGRPGPSAALEPTQLWARAGVWSLIAMRQDGLAHPLDALRGLGPRKETVLHGWVMASETPEKHRTLEAWLAQGLPVDSPDAQGRTPLWYAVDGYLARPTWHRQFLGSIQSLIAQGASPVQPDQTGVSPLVRAQAPLREAPVAFSQGSTVPAGNRYTAADRDALWSALGIPST